VLLALTHFRVFCNRATPTEGNGGSKMGANPGNCVYSPAVEGEGR